MIQNLFTKKSLGGLFEQKRKANRNSKVHHDTSHGNHLGRGIFETGAKRCL